MSFPERIFTSADDVEDAFYASFNSCDLSAMKEIWSESNAVCIHPGSSLIIGYAAIIRSWEFIFSDASLPDIQVNMIRQNVNDSLAIHVVEEKIATGNNNPVVIVATNVYQKINAGWLMIEHHGTADQMSHDRPTLQ